MADFASLLGGAGLGGAIGKAVVQLELDSTKYRAEMAAAEGQTRASTSKLGSAFTTVGSVAKAGLAAAAVGVVAFGANAVKAASDLGEAVNKSNVIFGKNAREIEAWAETGAEAFGLSKTAALDAAGGFGAMLQTAGLAVGESANMSKALVQLSGDMASFNNIDPTEALEKLRSGLAGEAEPLRRFGVFLSEAAVQQEAYQSGIAKTGEELTEAQKVQARYNIIFEQTTKQQGDFARTADSLPNQLRSMRAEFENVSAEVGERLLPVMSSLLGFVRDLIPLLGFMADNLDLVAGAAIAAFAALRGHPVIAAAAAALILFKEAADQADAEVSNLAATTDQMAGRFGGVVPIVDSATQSFAKFGEGIDENSEAIAKFRSEHTRVHGPIYETGEAIEKARRETVKAASEFDYAATTLDDLASSTKVSNEEFRTYFRTLNRESRDLQEAARDLRDEKWLSQDFVDFLSTKGPQWIITFGDLNETQQKRWQESWEDSNQRTKNANNNLTTIEETLRRLDSKTSKHTVKVRYEYENYDPSKPGMAGGTGPTRPGGTLPGIS